MVEARYKQTPEIFMRFRKNFRYHICLEELRVGKVSKTTSVMLLVCTLKKANIVTIYQKHYHLLLEPSSKFQSRGSGYAVPCLYSTFSFLIHTTSYFKLNGDTIEKLNRTVSYNNNLDNRSPFFGNTKRIRTRVPVVRKRNEKTAQTTEFSPVFLSRLNLILDGHHEASFYRIVDIFISGFGTIDNKFLAFHFDSSCLAEKDLENWVILTWAKISITFINVLQFLTSVRHRLVVLQGGNHWKHNEQCIYNKDHISSM